MIPKAVGSRAAQTAPLPQAKSMKLKTLLPSYSMYFCSTYCSPRLFFFYCTPDGEKAERVEIEGEEYKNIHGGGESAPGCKWDLWMGWESMHWLVLRRGTHSRSATAHLALLCGLLTRLSPGNTKCFETVENFPVLRETALYDCNIPQTVLDYI